MKWIPRISKDFIIAQITIVYMLISQHFAYSKLFVLYTVSDDITISQPVAETRFPFTEMIYRMIDNKPAQTFVYIQKFQAVGLAGILYACFISFM